MSDRLMSVEEYQRLIGIGHLTPDDKVELIENRIVCKATHIPQHAGTIGIVRDALNLVAFTDWGTRCRLTVVFSDSQTAPDISVVRACPQHYMTRYPTATDTGLIIEIAPAALIRDQRDKARIYARGNIVCYWIVNLDDRRIEVHTQPPGPCDSPAYASVVDYAIGETVPLVLDGLLDAVAVGQVAPGRCSRPPRSSATCSADRRVRALRRWGYSFRPSCSWP